MTLVDSVQRQIAVPADPATGVFQREWQIYRKMVDHNYLFHREAYDRLRQVLMCDTVPGFRFLDIACGDASATAEALKGLSVGRYHGIDLSQTALDIAAESLARLECPVELRAGDFAEALHLWREPVDVAWIGLSLHHLRTPAKLKLMQELRRIVGASGMLLIYENAGPDGEDRDTWLRRWDRQRPHWRAFTAYEWARIAAHVHAADFPETNSRWVELGHDAGFRAVRELFVAPTDLFRMYSFRA